MKRREFITLLGGGAAAWPLAARAQQAGNPARIGIVAIGSASNTYDASLVEAFRAGIRQVGRDEASIDLVWTKNDSEYAQAISDLVQRGASILVTAGTGASLAAKRQTSTIPIVFVAVGDPIGVGLVESLSHPGGNATGFSVMLFDITSKYVGLARELDKSQAMVYYLWYDNWALGENMFRATEQAAQSLHVELRSRGATNLGLATIMPWPAAGRDGALIGYGSDYAEMYRRAASYVDRTLKGAKPADLPVQQPTKFKLVINLKTAKTLGLTLPLTLQASANEVIE
jgi:putative ABC transport system substrate-binding protein